MRPIVILLICIAFLPSLTAAAEAELFDPAAASDTLAISLTGPLRSLRRDRKLVEHPFTLSVNGVDLPVKVRQRGNFRRQECAVPPLRLNLRKSDKGTLFAGQDKLKLVHACGNSERDEQNLLEEFLIYRIANLINPDNFRVRLLQVTWTDTEERTKWGQRYAFLIEDVGALAKRLGAEHVEPEKLSRDDLAPEFATQAALFQYLIGNTDFSQLRGSSGRPCCHNGKVLRSPARTIVVPYDFDMAGMVNAPYAEPAPQLGIYSVRKRLYRGFCVPTEVLQKQLAHFASLRQAIQQEVRTTPGLHTRNQASVWKYLETFFDEIESPNATTKFERACR